MKALRTTLLITIAFLCLSYAEAILPPRPSGPVADFAGVLDDDTKLVINTLARKLWVETGFGLLVVTVVDLGDESVDTFMRKLFRKWHVWKDNEPEGAVVLITVDPAGWHLVPGDGTREYLHDDRIAEMLPSMNSAQIHRSNVSARLVTLVKDIATAVDAVNPDRSQHIAANINTPPGKQSATTAPGRAFIDFQLIGGAGIAVILVFIILATVAARTRRAACVRKREPFGNVLSGDGFGGSMLRQR